MKFLGSLFVVFVVGLAVSSTLILMGWGRDQDQWLEVTDDTLADLAKLDAPTLHLNQLLSLFDDELLDPATSLPRTHLIDRSLGRKLLQMATNCVSDLKKATSPYIRKAFRWHRFRCGKRLPAGFFDRKPFMHPSGSSYAYLAMSTKHHLLTDLRWAQRNLHRFHALELRQLPASVTQALGEPYQSLMSLDRDGLRALRRRAPAIVGSTRLLMLNEEGRNDYYKSLPLKTVRGSLVARKLILDRVNGGNERCLRTLGELCIRAAEGAGRHRYLYWVSTSAGGGLAATTIGMIALHIRNRRREEEERNFILQTLTHELRTPVAGLVLQVEALRRVFDKLGSEGQAAFAAIADDTQRLSRLIAMSANYLKADSSERFAISSIASIQQFLTSTVERSGHDVRIQHRDQDLSIQTNPFWLSLCIQNLIDNAAKHGKPPIELTSRIEGDRFIIAVTDRGNHDPESLHGYLRPFSRNDHSKGLGLGLAIVKRALRGIGAQITIAGPPTTFAISIPLDSNGASVPERQLANNAPPHRKQRKGAPI